MKQLFLCLMLTAGLYAGDPLTGRWQFNFEKSPGSTAEISKFERDGDFFVNTNGDIRYRFQFDGKPHAAPNAQFDTVIWRQTGPSRFEHETKKAGRTVYAVVTEVAADGLSRTYRHTRYPDDGKTLVNDGTQDRVGGTVDAAYPLIGHWRLRRLMEWNAERENVTFRSGTLQFSAPRDGTDHPVIASTRVDTVALRRLGGFAVEVKGKRGGQLVFTNVYKVEGHTLTVTVNGQGAGVWERTR